MSASARRDDLATSILFMLCTLAYAVMIQYAYPMREHLARARTSIFTLFSPLL